jgi:hypothetical protein
MQMIQTELARGTSRLVTWLPQDRRVKVGTVISLHKSPDRWKVTAQSAPVDSGDIKRGWNNNI